MDIDMTLNCTVCGKKINGNKDNYFVLSDIATSNNNDSIYICHECGETVSPMDLYLSGKISMANSEDDALEVYGTVIESDSYGISEATPEEVEKFFATDEPTFTN